MMCRPVRPDAAVLVAAKHDVYVDMNSVKALQVRQGRVFTQTHRSCRE
jgi:hypothetical protein